MGASEAKPANPAANAAANPTSTSAANPAPKPANPGEGIRDLKTTNVFRVVNFELYAKPNKVVMLVGVAIFSGCLGYIAYWNLTQKDKGPSYMAIQEDGTLQKYQRKSRWD